MSEMIAMVMRMITITTIHIIIELSVSPAVVETVEGSVKVCEKASVGVLSNCSVSQSIKGCKPSVVPLIELH